MERIGFVCQAARGDPWSPGGRTRGLGSAKRIGGRGLVIGIAIGIAVGGTVSWAAIPDTVEGNISACYRVSGPSKGALRLIDYQAGERCVAGAQTSITVPTGTSALVVARWSGEIDPNGDNVSGVMLRITIDGTPMQPYAPPEGVNYGQLITFERSLTGIGAGSHDVTVQASLPSCGCSQPVNVGSSELVVEGAPQ